MLDDETTASSSDGVPGQAVVRSGGLASSELPETTRGDMSLDPRAAFRETPATKRAYSQLRVGLKPQSATLAAFFTVLLAIAVRLWYLTTTGTSTMDADQVTTALMVKNIMAGSKQYLYYAGQDYNGSLEQYLQAIMYIVFRLPQNGFTLRLVSVSFAAISTWFVYLVGARAFSSPWRGVLSAVLFACGPFFLIDKGIHSDGAYPSTQALAILSVYCAIRLRGEKEDSLVWIGLLGISTGLSVWTGLTGALLIVPACLWALATLVRSRKAAVVGLVALLIGLTPVYLWVVTTGTLPGPHQKQPTTSLWQRVDNVFGPLTREYLGVGNQKGVPGWPVALQVAFVILAVGAFVISIVVRRAGIFHLLTLRTALRRPVDLFLVAVLFTWIASSIATFSWYTVTPRYLFVAFPLLSWLLAACIPKRRGGAVAMVAAVLLIHIGSSAQQLALAADRVYVPTATDFTTAGHALISSGDVMVYGAYWDVIPLRYYGGDPITPAPLTTGNKFPEWRALVDASPTFVYIARTPDLKAVNGIAATLKKDHISFKSTVYGHLVVYSSLSSYPKPWKIGLGIERALVDP